MSNSIITARITGEEMQLVNLPLIASGSKGFLQIKCEFDTSWTGYGKTGVFYRTEAEVYHVPLLGDVVTVPHEVLNDDGYFFFGIMGSAENTRTTEALRLTVKQGAISIPTAEAEAPTPNIYEQILANYGKLDTALMVERARVDQLVALRGGGEGVEEYTISGDYFNGTIYSNGAAVFISVEFFDIPLAGNAERTDMCIPPQYAPLGLVTFKSLANSQSATITIQPRAWTGEEWAGITITNTSSTTITDPVEFEGYYELEALSIPELSDIRVGHDGRTFATAGAAVRDIGDAAASAGLQLDAEGAEVDLHDASNQPFRSFTLDGGGLMAGETVDIEVSGKNLFDISQIWQNYITTDGGIQHAATGYAADIYTSTVGASKPVSTTPENLVQKLPKLPAGIYTITFATNQTDYFTIYEVNEDGTLATDAEGNKKTHSGKNGNKFTLTNDTRITLRRTGREPTTTFYNIQIERGDTPTAYEPYKGRQEVTVVLEGTGTEAAATDVLAQHPGLTTYKPNTVIRTTRNGGMNMWVEYYGDTKTYIDSKFAELAAAVLGN